LFVDSIYAICKCPDVIRALFFNLRDPTLQRVYQVKPNFLWVRVLACDKTAVIEQTVEHGFSLKQL